MSKTYIHEGGAWGDFDFLEQVLEQDKVVKLHPSRHRYWKQKRVGPFCRHKENIPTEFLYDYLKRRHTPMCSQNLDDALLSLSRWVEKQIKKVGHNLKMRGDH